MTARSEILHGSVQKYGGRKQSEGPSKICRELIKLMHLLSLYMLRPSDATSLLLSLALECEAGVLPNYFDTKSCASKNSLRNKFKIHLPQIKRSSTASLMSVSTST